MSSPNRQHGGIQQFQGSEELLDFSVNINPYGPSNAMKQVIANCDYSQYPDPNSQKLKQALALRHNSESKHFHVGNGAAEIFWTIASVASRNGPCRAMILEPTFSELTVALTAKQANIKILRSDFQKGFQHDVDDIANALKLSLIHI